MGIFNRTPWVIRKPLSSPLGDIRGGEEVVGEFSLSSLKLKLFLFSDSAPEREREREK